jgi:transcriptional regulator with XRE-family HTH domain
MTIEAASSSDFGSLLRHFRKRARLTQNELAGLSTVSPRTIRSLEAGRGMRPRPETVRLLADGLRLGAESEAQLSLTAGQPAVEAALHAAEGHLPARNVTLDRDLYGREQELRSVLARVHNGTSCVVSVSGFGGVGKSSLAAALVREAEHSLHVRWLWLRPAEPADATAGPSFDAAFGQWHSGLAAGRSDAVEDLARIVGDQHYLIVIDGVDRPAPGLESALRELIQRCPRLTVVETTRRALPIEGRHVVPLQPLRLPASGSSVGSSVAGHPALRLLLPVVHAAHPDFQESEENLGHALEICRSLDGLPRALEAASTWFAFYPPATVAEAAREDPCAMAATGQDEAQGNWLRVAIGDALGDLTEAQRGLAAELATRTGPWTIDDLTGRPGRPSGSIVAALKTLLAKGVIRPADDSGSRRFTMLNLLRPVLA